MVSISRFGARGFICGLTALGILALQSESLSRAQTYDSWSPRAAAAYLDQRASWWMAWPGASRDHETFCVSCHTAMPYALARHALREPLGEAGPSSSEQRLLNNVQKRVRIWKDAEPFYHDNTDGLNKSAESRGTEAVLNALILASRDSQSGSLSDDTKMAFANMWALQLTTGPRKGSWLWLQFDNEPFEAHDSAYYGAALAAVGAGTAPENYRLRPEIQPNLELLRQYLNREYPSQSPMNHVVLLWASIKWPGLISQDLRAAIISEVVSKQRTDGGWSLASLAWTWRDWSLRSLAKMIRSDGTPLDARSDAYATALITFVLEQTGLPPVDQHVKQGLGWLTGNQDRSAGLWRANSINSRHSKSSKTGLFMSDAATAYAVLALTAAK